MKTRSKALHKLELELRNKKHILKQLRKEERRIEQLLRKGVLASSNGLDLFSGSCKERLISAGSLLERGRRVRTIAYRLAEASEQEKGRRRKVDEMLLSVIMKVGHCADVGMAMVLPELIMRPGVPMDPDERRILRLSHIEAAVELLVLYKDFMGEREHRIARMMIEGHHVAYDGIGTKNAPSYPDRVNNMIVLDNIEKTKTGVVRKNHLPEIMRIMRCADIFSAIMMRNPDPEKGRQAFGNLTGIGRVDAALAVLVAVAGIDVDPGIVNRLMRYGYGVKRATADLIIRNLSYQGDDRLQEKTDVSYADEIIVPDSAFRQMLPRRKRALSEILDTAVIEFGKGKEQ